MRAREQRPCSAAGRRLEGGAHPRPPCRRVRAAPPAGWQDHPVSNRKYHFIIPSREDVLADPRQLHSLVRGGPPPNQLSCQPPLSLPRACCPWRTSACSSSRACGGCGWPPGPGPLLHPAARHLLPPACARQVEAAVARQGSRRAGAPAAVDAAHLVAESSSGGDESAPYNAPASVFDSAAHQLHGMLHLNGFGHLVRARHGAARVPVCRAALRTLRCARCAALHALARRPAQPHAHRRAHPPPCPQLRVNGRGAAHAGLSGAQAMDVWDGVCALLCARRVSVEDVSTKSGMLLRMLHAAAHEATWCVGARVRARRGVVGYAGRGSEAHRRTRAWREAHGAPAACGTWQCTGAGSGLSPLRACGPGVDAPLVLMHPARQCTARYGKWGYTFGRGAFNISCEDYQEAVAAVHHAKVEALVHDFRGVDEVSFW